MRETPTRLRGLLSLSVAQSRHYRLRVAIAVVGIALAVALMTLLGGVGYGVVTKGSFALDATNRELWLTAPVEVAPGAVGGVENGIANAHVLVERVRTHPGVRGAQALSFGAVYVSPRPSDFETVVGVGITGTSAPLVPERGPGFRTDDVHYAGGTYDGPMTRELLVDERTAAALGVGVNDTLYVGGTIATARETRFRVVGVSSTFSTLLGSPTVTLHLSELQAVSGTTGTDPAAVIAISVTEGEDPAAVAADLERAYPGYAVRTNREQLGAVLRRQTTVLASTGAIVVVGGLVGTVLAINVLARLVYTQRVELAALRATGVSSRTLATVVAMQGLAVGVAGGVVGVLAAAVVAGALNRLVSAVVGFDALVVTPPWLYAVGLAVAVGMGALASAIAGLQVGRLRAIDLLKREA